MCATAPPCLWSGDGRYEECRAANDSNIHEWGFNSLPVLGSSGARAPAAAGHDPVCSRGFPCFVPAEASSGRGGAPLLPGQRGAACFCRRLPGAAQAARAVTRARCSRWLVGP
ncbi:unnamed protein product [Pleuronectes platessa]|uniref:Uncharacterized protein n=1 Tax=Pleuronectes platessa TaxID=8262 RepID=A0A9N7USV7_PLEPL|nr:unnamed protein product [Pleuronectes platessa]